MAGLINFREFSLRIDPLPLLDQVKDYPELWNIDDSWISNKPKSAAIYDVDNLILRFNKGQQWNREAFSILSHAQTIIFDLMRAIPAEHMGKVLITRLRPGVSIPPHIDHMPPGIPCYYQRYQIPLQAKAGVMFHCGGESLYMEPGKTYWFNNQLMHSVMNDSDEDRISMFADIRPFTPVDA